MMMGFEIPGIRIRKKAVMVFMDRIFRYWHLQNTAFIIKIITFSALQIKFALYDKEKFSVMRVST